MKFKDRLDAAKFLYKLLKNENKINKNSIVVSLLRGGAIIGDYLAYKLKTKHYPLVSVKISAPHNPEFAIGAICFDVIHINTKLIDRLNLSNNQISKQIKEAERKFIKYCTKFNVEESNFEILNGKTIVITDDGVATGSTSLVAIKFIKTKQPQKIILALPVAPNNFKVKEVDKSIIVIKDPSLSAISQYYKDFPQVEDKDIQKLKSLK